jgi:enoyl-CoA hydratase
MASEYSTLTVTDTGWTQVITLNRPKVRNALNALGYEELDDAIRICKARCLVITGAGSAFCAGDDVSAMMEGGSLAGYLDAHPTLDGPTEALLRTDIPVIAAVNGLAVGWGMELALLADIRIASTTARFGELYVIRGLCSDVAGMCRLVQLVGRDHAARLLFTGELIDARRALAMGVVGEVVDPDALLDHALALANRITANPPLAVRSLKAGMRRAVDPDWDDFARWARRAQADLSRTADHRESVASFLENRTPAYVGR